MLCLSGFKLYSRWVPLKGWFPLTRIFSVQTHVKFPCVNEIEAMYERSRVNVKVERGSTFTLPVTFHTLPPSPPWLPLFYLRAFIRKNYATVEIHLKTCYVNTRVCWFSRTRVVISTIPNWLSLRGRRSKGKGKGIRGRDHARGRRKEGNFPFSLARPTRSRELKFPLSSFNACHAGYNWLIP